MIWGRGALDMKGGVAMMTAAFLRAKAEKLALPGDVILCILSDEEAGGELGAKYMVENHAELFAGVKYAIGEFGGFPVYIGGAKFFAIQVSEKSSCQNKVIFRGPAGHGSVPRRSPDNATYKLAKALEALNTYRLPVHVTPAAENMVNAIADGLGGDMGNTLRQLLDPVHTDAVLDELGDLGRQFDAILHNTASPNIVRGGDKINVVPGQVEIDIDMRVVPGFDPQEAMDEIRALVGEWGESRADAPQRWQGLSGYGLIRHARRCSAGWAGGRGRCALADVRRHGRAFLQRAQYPDIRLPADGLTRGLRFPQHRARR